MITLKDTVQHNSSCYIAKVVKTEVASSPNTKPLDCTLYIIFCIVFVKQMAICFNGKYKWNTFHFLPKYIKIKSTS